MSLKNCKVVLTIQLEGRLTVRGRNSSSPKLIRRVMSDKKFVPYNNYKEPEYGTCVKKVNLSEEQVNYYISENGCPSVKQSDVKHWKKLSENERLNAHCALIAEGKKFNWEPIIS